MMYNYRKEKMQNVTVKGVPCEFTDVRLDIDTIPEEKYLYEVADGDGDGEPARIRKGIWANFFGSIVCNEELKAHSGETLGVDDTLWLDEGDWKWGDEIKMIEVSFDKVKKLHEKGELTGVFYMYPDGTEGQIDSNYKWEDIVRHYEAGGKFGEEL